MKVGILGVGSLGTIIGALMTKNGQPVDLIDVSKENVDALNQHGATITGSLQLNVPVKAVALDELTQKYDLIFLLTKQTNNESALPAILPFLHENSTVCTLQNGIPEERVASFVGKERTVGGAVGFGATWVKPGVSSLTSTLEAVEKFGFEIGEISGEVTPRIEKVQEVLSKAGGTIILTNLMGIRWTKVLMNATFSGMSAALGCTFGRVLDDEKAMTCLAYIADETIKVCHKLGYRMVEMQGLDMEKFELQSKANVPSKMPMYHQGWDRHYDLEASMLQDLQKGRPTEIDYINGVVAENGRQVGVATPFNDKVIELVKEAEARKGVNDFSYLSRFDEILEKAK